jgi:hypothetical protein
VTAEVYTPKSERPDNFQSPARRRLAWPLASGRGRVARGPTRSIPNRYRGACACGSHHWAVLNRGFVTLVSPEDGHLLQWRKWCVQPRKRNAYAISSRGSLHRAILGDVVQVDHVDHNGLNNQRPNLRPATPRQNSAYSRRKPNASGYRGVYRKESGRWIVLLGGRSLGTFDNPEEAARMYDRAAAERYGAAFTMLNFPQSATKEKAAERANVPRPNPWQLGRLPTSQEIL